MIEVERTISHVLRPTDHTALSVTVEPNGAVKLAITIGEPSSDPRGVEEPLTTVIHFPGMPMLQAFINGVAIAALPLAAK